MNLLIFILASMGLTNAMVEENIFAWLRNLVKKYFPYSLLNDLVNCQVCMGFWVGIGLSLIFPFGVHWFLCGLISSAVIKLIYTIIYKF